MVIAPGVNVAPQLRAAVITVEPEGWQSPVNPVNVNPESTSTLSATCTPAGFSNEQSEPCVPHLMPGPTIVPPAGLLIVSG
jgi:hypothetical protein